MKKLLIISLLLLNFDGLAQLITPPPTGAEPVLRFGQIPGGPLPCGTVAKKSLRPIPKTDLARMAQPKGVLPYCIKVYLTVFANDNGTFRASTDADQVRQFNAMVEMYRPHSICFVLMGIRQINNSDLNDQDKSEESELEPYLIPGMLNVFTHAVTRNGGNLLGGFAYDIPNTGAYASLWGGNISGATDNVTMAHEVGHVLGLLHTFERHPGDPFHDKESVERNPNASCWDCDTDGDYICDTPADPDQDDENGGQYLVANTTLPSAGCVYTGNRRDECDVLYTPATNNFMSYGRFECLNAVTVGQGTRMRYYLANESDFSAILAPEFVTTPVLGPVIRTVGEFDEVARDVLTIGEIQPYLVQQTAQVQMQSKRIVLKPGVHFSPGAGGRVQVVVNPNCN